MKKPKFGKTGRVSSQKGEIKRPKALKGMLKQTEGYTPKESMATGKQAGLLKGAKRREKRLADVPM